jgi:anti-sigma B factor antagonist
MALHISVTTIGGNPAIELKGRIVDVDVRKFHKKMDSICQKKAPKIVLDISEVEFIDSHGLGIIIFFHQTLLKNGCQLVILNRNPNPNSYISRLFEITNLDQILTIKTDPVAV